MVRQKKAPAARRRPMSREEALARQERQRHQREMEEESRELARGPLDLPFFILVLLLTGIGLVMLLSASFPSAYYETDGQNPLYYFTRQGVFAIMGVAAMLFIGKINYQRFRGLAKPLLYLSVILLILVAIPGNPLAITRNNATRWLGIPGTSLQFQPSEIAKLAVIIYFGDSISKKKDRMRTFRYGILPYVIILVVLAGLVGIEPHLSGAILVLGVGAVMMLVGGIHWGWVGGAIAAAGGLLYFVDVEGYPPQAYEHDMKLWWVHTEALIAAIKLYRVTGKERYFEDFKMLMEYCFAHFNDEVYGEWYGYLRRDGAPTEPRAKGNVFKGPFHVPRMYCEVIRELEKLERM